MKYSESMTISCKRPAIPSMMSSLRWRRRSSGSLTARKRRLSLQNAARTKRKSAQLPSAHCMAYGLHRKRTAEGSLSALSCTRLMSRKNGRERLGKRFRTPMLACSSCHCNITERLFFMKAHDDMVLLNINQIETILTERGIRYILTSQLRLRHSNFITFKVTG